MATKKKAKKPLKRFAVVVPSYFYSFGDFTDSSRWYATRAAAERAAMAASKTRPKTQIPVYELIAYVEAPVGTPQIKRYPSAA